MKLHFEPNLDYQMQAIEAVCDLFRGQEVCRTEFTVTMRAPRTYDDASAAQGALEGMLATAAERDLIQLGLASIADRCEAIDMTAPPVSCCADCGSDNCCLQFAEGMES